LYAEENYLLKHVAIAAIYVLFAIRTQTIHSPVSEDSFLKKRRFKNGRTAIAGGVVLISIRAASDLQIGQRLSCLR
jgi:hypothetical protein